MNYLDFAILGFIGIGAFVGLVRGFVKELINTLGILIAAIAANLASPYTAPFMGKWVTNDTLAAVIVWVVVFLVVLFLLNKLGYLISKLLKAVMLGWVNHLLGFVLGALKYILIVCLIISLLELVSSWSDQLTFTQYLEESKLRPYIHDIVGFISPYAQKYIIQPVTQLL